MYKIIQKIKGLVKRDVDSSYSTNSTNLAGTDGVDKSGRSYKLKVHTDGFSFARIFHLGIIFVYFIKELFPAFIVSELFFTFVYLIKGIQEAVEKIVNKGLPASEVLTVVAYLVGKALPLTTPMAILMAGIVVVGRLSADSEITAMRAAGISYKKILRSFIVMGIFLIFFTFYLSQYFSPKSFRKIDAFEHFIRSYNPIAVISPGEFVGDKKIGSDGSARKMYVERKDPKTGELINIQIREIQKLKKLTYLSQLISARKGVEIMKQNRHGKFFKVIRLYDGFVISYNIDQKTTEITDFRKGIMDLNMESGSGSKKKFVASQPAHFNFSSLLKKRARCTAAFMDSYDEKMSVLIADKNKIQKRIKNFILAKEQYLLSIEAASKTEKKKFKKKFKKKWKTLSVKTRKNALRKIKGKIKRLKKRKQYPCWKYTFELHSRFSYSIYAFLFAILGFPLGLLSNRSGRGMGFVSAILLIVIYVSSFNISQRLAGRFAVAPEFAPWLGVILVAFMTLYFLYFRTANTSPKALVMSFYYKMKLKLKSRSQ